MGASQSILERVFGRKIQIKESKQFEQEQRMYQDKSLHEIIIDSREEVLLKWAKCGESHILFDSDTMGTSHDFFNNAVSKKNNLYFIIQDENQNIFGVYIKHPINRINQFEQDLTHFVFSLENNSRCQTPFRWECMVNDNSIKLNDYGDYMFLIGGSYFGISKIGLKKSYSWNSCISYRDITEGIVTGNNFPDCFVAERIVVIQTEN